MVTTAVALDDHPLPAGLKARLWLKAEHLLTRAGARDRCWLWMLHENGTLAVVNLDAGLHGRDSVLPVLLVHWSRLSDSTFAIPELGEVQGLPVAPLVPSPRWAMSWGHPLQRQIRAFAQALDEDVLNFLGELEARAGFWGCVENYNRLAALEGFVRVRWMQALRDFPPLLLPLLLRIVERPELFAAGYADVVPSVMPWQKAAGEAIGNVIKQSGNLVKALAEHYRISRALVRSPLCRDVWCRPEALHKTLPLLDAMAAHARPRSLAALEKWLPSLRALPVVNDKPEALARIASCFAGGWSATWSALAIPHTELPGKLRDCRDFLQAAIEQEHLPASLLHITPEALGSAWLAYRGIASLLQASQRWHQQPLQALSSVPAMSESLQLRPLLGHWQENDKSAQELLSEDALILEGDAMRHCVGGYWHQCVSQCSRIVHLTLPEGEQATACFAFIGIDVDGPHFELVELRGPDNDDPSPAMEDWAEQVAARINAAANEAARREAWQEAQIHARNCQGRPARHVRRLDRRSRQVLQKVLENCAAHDFRLMRDIPHLVLRGEIAGTGYAQAPQLLPRLCQGDRLHLVREPDNPHDPHAIRLDWQGCKLGYVPRRENRFLAARLDAGVQFESVLVHVDESEPRYPRLVFCIHQTSPD